MLLGRYWGYGGLWDFEQDWLQEGVDGLSGSAHPMSQTDVLINPNPPTCPHQTATTCFIATILNPMTLVNAFKPKMQKTRNFHKTLNTKRLSYWNVQHNIINKTKERRMSKY